MKKILLIFFVIITFAYPNSDPAKGTLYQKGGKIFSAVDANKAFFQVKLSFDTTYNWYTMERLRPKPVSNQDTVTIFTKLLPEIIKPNLEFIFPSKNKGANLADNSFTPIDSTAKENLTNEIMNDDKKFNIKKAEVTEKLKLQKILDLSFKTHLIKKNGKFYNTNMSNKTFEIKLTYEQGEKPYKIKRIKPDPKNTCKDSLASLDENMFIMVIDSLFKDEFKKIPDPTKNGKETIDTLNLYKLGVNFYKLIQKDINAIEKEKSGKLTEIKIDSLKKKFEKLLEKEKRTIGKIGFRGKLDTLIVPVYNYKTTNKKAVGFFKIESAQIAFGDGVVAKINVNGTLSKDNKKTQITFFNFLPPIPIRTRKDIDYFNTQEWENRYWLDAQYCDMDDKKLNLYIYLSDVLFYEQNLIYNYGIYIPPDGKVISLNDSVVTFELKKESFVNDFDLRIYSDFTGLDIKNPNGIFKFKGNYRLKLHYPKRRYDAKENRIPIYYGSLLKYANLFFNFNKIEGSEVRLPIKALDSNYLYSGSFDIYRHLDFEIGAEINFYNYQGQSTSVDVNFLAGAFHTSIDSTLRTDTTANGKILKIDEGLNSFYTGLKLNFGYLANAYVAVDINYSIMFPQLITRTKLREIYGSIEERSSIDNARGPYLDFDFAIHKFAAEVSLFPDPEDKSSYLFLKSELNLAKEDNYFSLLVGYALPLSNVFAIGQSAARK